MQYSQIAAGGTGCKFAPDSSFFVYSEGNKLYIKDSSVQIKNIGIINAPSQINETQISWNSKYIAVFMAKKSLIHIYKVQDSSLCAKIQDSQAGIVSFYWAVGSLQLLVFSQFMYKVSIYNFVQQNMCYIKGPKMFSQKGFSFSSDGKFMALLEKHQCKDYLSIYYSKDWKLVNTFPLDLLDAAQVKWSPNNSYLAVWDNCINYRLLVFSHMSGLVFRYEPYNFALGIKSVKFSNNSFFLAIGSFDEKIRLINALTWQEIGELDCSNPIINCEKTVVHKEEEISKNVNRLRIVEEKTYKIPIMKVTINQQKGVPNQGVSMLEFSEDDMYLSCKNDNMPYTVWIWDISYLEPAELISCSNPIKNFKWTKNENYLSIINGTDHIIFWRESNKIAECIFSFQNKKLSIQKIKWSNDGSKALIFDKNQYVYAEIVPEVLDKQNYY